MSFIGVLEAVGKGFEKGLKWALTYAIPVEKLLVLLFPAAAPVAAEIDRRHDSDPERRSAGGAEICGQRSQSGTGAEKLSRGAAAYRAGRTALLTKAGVTCGRRLHRVASSRR